MARIFQGAFKLHAVIGTTSWMELVDHLSNGIVQGTAADGWKVFRNMVTLNATYLIALFTEQVVMLDPRQPLRAWKRNVVLIAGLERCCVKATLVSSLSVFGCHRGPR